MTVDLTKLILHSSYPAYINDAGYSSFFTISGSTTAGTNTRTANVFLNEAPDLIDFMYNKDGDANWKKQGTVTVLGTDSPLYIDYPTLWTITTKVNGSTLTITATFSQQFTATLALDSTAINYKLVDYSIFD
jgi:hypothetical protein